MMQPRFEKRTGNTPYSLVEQPRFRAGFDFMRLRADVGEVDVVLADWWQEFSQASDSVREDLLAQLRDEQGKGQRRVRVPRPPAVAPDDESLDTPEEPATDAPPKRRRRRRRSGASRGGADGAGSTP